MNMQQDMFGWDSISIPHPYTLTPGRFALSERITTVMSRVVQRCRIDRSILVSRITALTGKRLSLSVFNAQTALSRPDQSPSLLHAMAFDAISGEWALLKIYAEAAGARLVFGDDIVALEMGLIERKKQQLRRRDSILKRMVG